MYIIYIKEDDGSQRTLDTVLLIPPYLQSTAGDNINFLIRALDSCENASDYSIEHIQSICKLFLMHVFKHLRLNGTITLIGLVGLVL